MLLATRHAQDRMRSRSIRQSDLAAFQEFADLEIKAGGGAQHLRMSRKAVSLAIKSGLDPARVARIARISIVECEGRILTVYRLPLTPVRRTKAYVDLVAVEIAA